MGPSGAQRHTNLEQFQWGAGPGPGPICAGLGSGHNFLLAPTGPGTAA